MMQIAAESAPPFQIKQFIAEAAAGNGSFTQIKSEFERSINLVSNSFAEDMVAITRAVIAIARSLNLEIVAEGVESAAQRDFLLEAGSRYCQGYFYGKACTAEEFERRYLPLLAA